MIVLIDTNVLLDCLEKRVPFDDAAARVWDKVVSGVLTGYARKSAGRAKAIESLRMLRDTFQTVPLDERVIDTALSTSMTDFEDAIQAAAAERVSADYVVTRDLQGFRGSTIPAVTAEELLAVLPG